MEIKNKKYITRIKRTMRFIYYTNLAFIKAIWLHDYYIITWWSVLSKENLCRDSVEVVSFHKRV